MLASISSAFGSVFGGVSSFGGNPEVSDERMEEYRMISGFKSSEILRLYHLFYDLTDKDPLLTRDKFLSISFIESNPLRFRIAMCFGYDEERNSLNFEEFLSGVSLFNSPGQREQKLRTAFRIQDFDGDGVINKGDLMDYLKTITSETLGEEELQMIASQVLMETSSDLNQESISFGDFQKVVAPLDFQAKLLLPI
jgi:Ca2+-binding EF-hand superfamily protein